MTDKCTHHGYHTVRNIGAEVPVLEGYTGKKVKRKEVFQEEEDDSGSEPQGGGIVPFDDASGDEADGDEGTGMASGVAGGFSISGQMEQEYDRMMKATQHELEVMRKPSPEDLAQREKEATALKKQLEIWGSLVELRIHLEGALSVGHRLPSGGAGAAFREDAAIAKQASDAATDSRSLVGSLLSLQQHLAQKPGLDPAESAASASAGAGRRGEASSWSLVDARLQPVLDWSLEVADTWKERTRLDARRSFKVLDQSFRLQMQAVSEAPPEKLRTRCTPPPGKHKVFGTASASTDGQNEAAGDDGEDDAGAQDIFDDRDFYVQLLREVLTSNSGTLNGGEQDRELRAELQGPTTATTTTARTITTTTATTTNNNNNNNQTGSLPCCKSQWTMPTAATFV
ncbi:unnamed protein product [Polarella glacialis]|uniref:AATF leucine zipper-containing domain-containing protein n=1 Tax=Polarella glacialis TaxID=89957 RepID=A0A813DS13_POLGL|nr:unnamed protein product [Polarella glacialis]